MMVENIENLMAYRAHNGRVLGVDELAERYPLRPLGTQTYYGLVHQNVALFQATGRALQPAHRVVVDGLLAALLQGYAPKLTFQLVMEPLESPDQYGFVLDHLELVEAVATELAAYCREAAAQGKTLGLILRFGSEMNDAGGTSYTGDPSAFAAAFRAVSDIVRRALPEAQMPFSPALRADIDITRVSAYWPGEDCVDLVGATWYVHGAKQHEQGFAKMHQYFLEMAAHRKSFSLDEFGGALGSGDLYYGNDEMLPAMLDHVASMAKDGITFEHGTLFLDERKYGIDATLHFIT